MTLQETKFVGDPAIYYDHDDGLWYWAMECGYESYDARKGYPTAAEAEQELIKWLETFEGPTK